MLLKTLRFVLPGQSYKILGTGRTDAKVSALETAFELFLEDKPLTDPEIFMQLFNENLPPDMKALSIRPVTEKFNIIGDCKEKEYLYFFAFGQKIHPFCAPFMACIPQQLDIELMCSTAPIFKGTHNFRAYTVKNGNKRQYSRSVIDCTIEENRMLTANFFPEQSYLLRIRGQGFMRYQVRMIMGALFEVGRGIRLPAEITESLREGNQTVLTSVAPGSGLMLNTVHFI